MLCVSNEQCMKEEKIPPASVDYASAVSNTSGTGKLSFGSWIHFQAFFIPNLLLTHHVFLSVCLLA